MYMCMYIIYIYVNIYYIYTCFLKPQLIIYYIRKSTNLHRLCTTIFHWSQANLMFSGFIYIVCLCNVYILQFEIVTILFRAVHSYSLVRNSREKKCRLRQPLIHFEKKNPSILKICIMGCFPW